MGISIKHDDYEKAIRRLANHRGVSLTEAVGQAVYSELERAGIPVPGESYLDRVKRLHELLATLPVLDDRTPDEILGYDENGLPT